MVSATNSNRNGKHAGPARLALDALALDRLIIQVLTHFERHQPEPASFPALASRVIDLAEHPDVDVGRLAHLIERDPAICAAVLGVANSAANRRADPVQSVRTAVSLLGLKRVANIAVGVACRSLFDVELRVEHELFPGWWERLFHAAMTEAFTVSFIAMERSRHASEGIFLAGMLHNIGKSLALRSLSGLLISGELPSIPNDEAIEALLQRTRVAIGVSTLTTFNMPDQLIALCRHQDDTPLPAARENVEAHWVRLVSSLNELRMGTLATEIPIQVLLDSAQALAVSAEDVLAIARQLSDHSAQVGLLFSSNDGADESGYLEFVARCLTGGAPATRMFSDAATPDS
jgi:HD-like signal output (HDOD) protein